MLFGHVLMILYVILCKRTAPVLSLLCNSPNNIYFHLMETRDRFYPNNTILGVAITFIQISMQQMKCWWFILDVISIFPFFEIIGDGKLAGINKLLRVPKVNLVSDALVKYLVQQNLHFNWIEECWKSNGTPLKKILAFIKATLQKLHDTKQ